MTGCTFGCISSKISAGTENESLTVLPLPVELQRVDERGQLRIVLALEPGEGNHAVEDAAQVLGGLGVVGFGAELGGDAAVDVAGNREPLDRGNLASRSRRAASPGW